MDYKKSASLLEAGIPTPRQLEQINKQAKTPLQAESVYVFAVRLCDNQPDRDHERFADDALTALAPMFVGKTGILDHTWSSEKQLGRIFCTEIIDTGSLKWLKAWVYMLRSEKTEGLIREIEGGIKKEVSVGCAMNRTVCSICGEDYGSCSHRKGEVYGGEICLAVLTDPADAYEFSFVAVPAQRDAGVVKAAAPIRDAGETLRKEAEYGRMYRKKLERDLVKAGLLLELGLEEALWQKLAKALDMDSLISAQQALEEKAAQKLPLYTQLPGTAQKLHKPDSAYMI